MKKWAFLMVMGWVFLMVAPGQAQIDKMMERFLPRGESRLRTEDLRIIQLEFSPDPIREGQRITFQVTVLNDSRQSGRITLVVKDRDEVVTEARDVMIRPGENRIEFPGTNYRFSRTDQCFTVEADIESTRRPIDLAKEFCAQRTYSGWSLSDRGVGPLFVEDLGMNPDPAAPGQEVQFRVRLRNDGRPIRGNIRIQDKDQIVVQSENVSIPRGYSDFQFPFTRYAFQRFDHCFTVLVDFERTPYPVDASREFCAKPMGLTLQATAEPARPITGRSQWDISFFYDELSPYGEWFQIQGYGWVWTPNNVPHGWRPYTHGRWAYTDDGWTWISDWEWGWGPFHYGRWLLDNQYGWVWVPGREWAPAWVAWRSGPGWIGWAPLPPGAGVDFRASIEGAISSFGWSFIEDRLFLEANLRINIISPARNRSIIPVTQNVTNYAVVQNRIVNRSINVDQIERIVRGPVPRYRIVDRDTAPAVRERVKGNEVNVFRRTLTEAPPGRVPRPEVAPRQAPGSGQRPDASSLPPKSMSMPDLLQRQELERRELLTHQENQRARLEQEQRREIQQPPKGKSVVDLRREHESEKRDLEENLQREKQLLQSRQERERKATGAR